MLKGAQIAMSTFRKFDSSFDEYSRTLSSFAIFKKIPLLLLFVIFQATNIERFEKEIQVAIIRLRDRGIDVNSYCHTKDTTKPTNQLCTLTAHVFTKVLSYSHFDGFRYDLDANGGRVFP